MPEPDWLICCQTGQRVIDRGDGTGSKVAGLQSEVGHRIAGQYCHVHVLWRGTAGWLSSTVTTLFLFAQISIS